ncbi:MAG: FtsW/RodA/SpoVE family cell cycle protein [Ignavibacteria bacterium]|nr:FtsW/RodA/SpoVE family cell cycle protein [Ignavibacteria bacterium]
MIGTQRNHIDLPILVCVLILMVMSMGVVYSASSTWALEKFGESERLLTSHATKVVAGFLAIFIFMNIDYKRYRKRTKLILILAVLLLVTTLVLDSRWLRHGGFGFQPSEFAKYALVFHLCVLMSDKKEHIADFKTGFLPMMIWIVAVTSLVLLQPDFSSGAIIFVVSFLMLFIGRASFAHIGFTVGALVPVLIAYLASAEYRYRRIMDFGQRISNFVAGGGDLGAKGNYQLWQGIIGFGNGGIFGLGPGHSRQRDFFLPESYGDFVFSVVGEEYGLIGTLCILLLFVTVTLRGFRVAKHARDDFGAYLAIGITTCITLCALINAGVTVGILPTTGLPMPFVSYGGSSMLFSSIAIGVLLNISSQTDMHPRLTKAPGGTQPVELTQLPAAGNVF